MDDYNVKIIEHKDGTSQIRTYDGIMGNQRKHSKKINPALDYLKSMGFGKCREVSVERWNESLEQKKARENLNLLNSVNRTKKRVNELARSCEMGWEYFCSLTFSPDTIDRTDFQLCMKKVRAWLNNQRKCHSPDLRYLCVPEAHSRTEANGLPAWHVHILLADVGTMIFEDSHKVAIGKKAFDRNEQNKHYPTIYNLSGWKWGFSTAIPITHTNGHRISHYITKYITKQMYLMAGNCHKYYASQNLGKPKVSTYNIPQNLQKNFVNHYLEKTNKKIVYEKNTSRYIDTTFYETDDK